MRKITNTSISGNQPTLTEVIKGLLAFPEVPSNADEIVNLLMIWNNACLEADYRSNNNLDAEVLRLQGVVKDVKKTIKALKVLKNNKSYAGNLFLENPGEPDKTALELQNYIDNCESTISFITAIKRSKISKQDIKTRAIMEIFAYGEKLGLQSDGKQGAGSGKGNRLLKFAMLITGIKGRNTMLDYYKKYAQAREPAHQT